MSQENVEIFDPLRPSMRRDMDALSGGEGPRVESGPAREGWRRGGITRVGREAWDGPARASARSIRCRQVEPISDFIAAGDRVVVQR